MRRCDITPPRPMPHFWISGEPKSRQRRPNAFSRSAVGESLPGRSKERGRRADAQRDQRNAADLITSVKEIAELVMITDLERNDLGRVCEYGSVTVSELLKLESYEQVHHLVSTVAGTLRGDVTHSRPSVLVFPEDQFPELEETRLGLLLNWSPIRAVSIRARSDAGYNGESQFSIAIRTAVFENGRASFHVGAGIVADSTPQKEWRETLDKAG